MPSGRKGYGEELQIKQRYADLSAKAFVVLSEMLDSEDKNDKKWAVEQLSKGLVKMIPQDMDVTSNGEALGVVLLPQRKLDEDTLETNEETAGSVGSE